MMKASRPRRVFKSLLGQANHFLVTIVVGLEAVKDGANAPSGLRAAWSPKNKIQSARRSRHFALSAGLARSVDSVDAYLSVALRRPSIVESPVLRGALEAAGRSVTRKLIAVSEHYPALPAAEVALVRMVVIRRNALVHTMSEDEVEDDLLESLRSSAADIRERYRGLDIERTIVRTRNRALPSLKEVAGAISACQRYIEALDSALLRDVVWERYLSDVIVEHAKKNTDRHGARRRLAELWGREPERRRRSIVQILQSEASVQPDSGAETDKWIESLSNSSFSEAASRLGL
jgi:hypothetical protein